MSGITYVDLLAPPDRAAALAKRDPAAAAAMAHPASTAATLAGRLTSPPIVLADLAGRSRNEAISRARQVAYRALDLHGLTMDAIGRAFGRDHSTVCFAIKRVRARPEWEAEAQEIARALAAPYVEAYRAARAAMGRAHAPAMPTVLAYLRWAIPPATGGAMDAKALAGLRRLAADPALRAAVLGALAALPRPGAGDGVVHVAPRTRHAARQVGYRWTEGGCAWDAVGSTTRPPLARSSA